MRDGTNVRPERTPPERTRDASPDTSSHPNVLFVSVGPFSATSNNGKTFASFFEGYPEGRVAQLYFHREIPSSDVSRRYYRFTDGQLLRSLLPFHRFDGERVTAESIDERGVAVEVSNPLRSRMAIRALRSQLWGRLNLLRGPFAKWLDEFKPDMIFFCGGNANHLYRPVMDLARARDIPIVYYITDDYVLRRFTLNPFVAGYRSQTRRLFKKCARTSALVLTIGEEMQDRYRSVFGIESQVIMNSVDVIASGGEPARADHGRGTSPLTLSYLGGLHSGRDEILATIAQTIAVDDRLRSRIQLNIYTQAAYPESLLQLSHKHPEVLRLNPPVTADEVQEIQNASDLLLHVESFSKKNRQITELSVSTKIPEYLASCTPVVAVGPGSVASIRYLQRHGVATVVSRLVGTQLADTLHELIENPEQTTRKTELGLQLARERHHAGTNRSALWKALDKIHDARSTRRG